MIIWVPGIWINTHFIFPMAEDLGFGRTPATALTYQRQLQSHTSSGLLRQLLEDGFPRHTGVPYGKAKRGPFRENVNFQPGASRVNRFAMFRFLHFTVSFGVVMISPPRPFTH